GGRVVNHYRNQQWSGRRVVGSEMSQRERFVFRIQPSSGWKLVDWNELVAYRDLFWFLSLRDVKVRYKQTVLGLGWAIIRPVISMVIFSIIFGNLANVPSDGVPYPIFTLAALVPWTYFSAALTDSTQSLVANARMLSKVYFPRLAIPMAPVLGGLIDFAISFVILVLMMVWFGVVPTAQVWILPICLLMMIVTAAGVGLWLSTLAILYRDFRQAIAFIVQLLMYAAPVVWPVSLLAKVGTEWESVVRLLYGFYPMAGVIEGFRASLLGTTSVPWDLLGSGAIGAIVLLITGLLFFQRTERYFADVA
ncbi:MAG TPA: ABC transporter permease, partial [Rhodothermales bacterium]|nr:ABC transporter permease [Rhodothermales bacterium]